MEETLIKDIEEDLEWAKIALSSEHWEDIKEHKDAKFVTLTFTDNEIKKLHDDVIEQCENNKIHEEIPEGYEMDNRIATLGIRRFLERWRKEHKTSVRHWLITELGHKGTENIHVHGLIWHKDVTEIEKHWQYGWVWKGIRTDLKNGEVQWKNYVNDRTINYIIKYITKSDEKHKGYKGKVHTSKGIGRNYTKMADAKNNAYNGKHTKEFYRTRTGHKINLPIYYRNKIYTEAQREKLWLDKLDKEIRYVCGEKIQINNGDKDYQNILEYHRRINTQLGYGTGYRTEEEIEYQKQRRKLMMLTRIEKAKGKRP